MVKFTSTVVAASLFAGSAIAAPAFSRSDNVAVFAREIESMFGREMVQYAARSPAHLHEVVRAVDAVNTLVARHEGHQHNHGEGHPHNHGEGHPHNHEHNHSHATGGVEPSADPSATNVDGPQRRSYDYYGSVYAREIGDGTTTGATVDASAPAPVAPTHPHQHSHDHMHGHNHALHSHDHTLTHHHNGLHTHPHPHVQEAAPVGLPPVTGGPGPANQRRGYGEYSDLKARSYGDYYGSVYAREITGDPTTGGAVDNSASAPAPVAPTHPHQHSHDHMHGHNHALHSHDHTLTHHHNGLHTHPHPHVQAAPAAEVAQPGRRSLDFDALYTRYIDFDDLD